MKLIKLKNLINKKGVTLIELLVSFAIFMVLCAALVGFISMSSNSYRRTSATVNLQIEYQIAMTMINEYIIDCDDRITFSAADGLRVFNTNGEEFRFTLVTTGDNRGLFLDGGIISRNIIAFDVLREEDNLLAVSMTFTSLNRNYSATQLTALRNAPDTSGVPPRLPPEPEQED
jgi:competence protein ComGC